MELIRKQTGLTIWELAQLIKVSPSLLGHYEKGGRNLPDNSATRIGQLSLVWTYLCQEKSVSFEQLNQMVDRDQREWEPYFVNLLEAANAEVKDLNRIKKKKVEQHRMIVKKILLVLKLQQVENDALQQKILSTFIDDWEKVIAANSQATLLKIEYRLQVARARVKSLRKLLQQIRQLPETFRAESYLGEVE